MKKILIGFKRIAKEYVDLLIFFVLIIIADISVRTIAHLGIGKLPIVFDFLFYCILSIPIVLLNKKIRIFIEFIIVLFLSVYGFSQSLHFSFFSSFFSIRKITVIGELTNVFNEVFTKLNFKFVIFMIPIFIYVLYIMLNAMRKKDYSIGKLHKLVLVVTLIICIVLCSVVIRVNINAGIETENWLSDGYLLESFHNNVRFYDRFGIVEYIFKDLQMTLDQKTGEKPTNEERITIEKYISENNKHEANYMTNAFQGKNLVLVLAESLSNNAISEELTPTLYKMKEKGIYFDNYYAPIYQSATGDSEFISLTSMIPSVDYGTTSYTFYNNYYPNSLAKLFSDVGYSSNSYHSYITNFYNREIFHASLGFSTFYDESKLGIERNEYFIDGFNWHNDDILFNRTIANTNYKEGPFFDFVITSSGHMPYVEERDEIFLNLEKIENSSYNNVSKETKYYLSTQMNLDKGLEQLITDLNEIKQLDNTIIIIFGDHYPYGLESTEAIDEIIGQSNYEKYKVPFIIYDPSTDYECVISKLGSTFDIYPTICNLFGLDSSNYFVAGNDLFSDEEGIVPFMDRSILSKDFFFDSSLNSMTVLSDDYTENSELEYINKVNCMFNIGQLILRKNYYENR